MAKGTWGGYRPGSGRKPKNFFKEEDDNFSIKITSNVNIDQLETFFGNEFILAIEIQKLTTILSVMKRELKKKARGRILETLPWKEILETGEVISDPKNGRRFVKYAGIKIPYATIVWNVNNPDNILREGELIHHIDNNPSNDSDTNLAKMTKSSHSSLHINNGITLDKIKKYIGRGLDISEIAKIFGTSERAINVLLEDDEY